MPAHQITQLPFSPLYDWYAAKPFTYEGVEYKDGAPFPRPNEDGSRPVVAHRLLRQLYEQRKISAVPPIIAPLPAAPAPLASANPNEPPPPVGNELPPPPAPPKVTDASQIAVKHKGFGKWFVINVETGESLAGPYASAEEAHLLNPQVPRPPTPPPAGGK